MDAFVDLFITLCIIVNTAFMALDYEGMSQQQADVLSYGNYVSGGDGGGWWNVVRGGCSREWWWWVGGGGLVVVVWWWIGGGGLWKMVEN